MFPLGFDQEEIGAKFCLNEDLNLVGLGVHPCPRETKLGSVAKSKEIMSKSTQL